MAYNNKSDDYVSLAHRIHVELLAPEEEQRLARAWLTKGDQAACHAIIVAHIPLADSLAAYYARRYASRTGMVFEDFEELALTGLARAVGTFDPAKARFSTHAASFIKSEVREHIMRQGHSQVNIITGAVLKELYFNLNRVKAELGIAHPGDLPPDELQLILDVFGQRKKAREEKNPARKRTPDMTAKDVLKVNRYLQYPDTSLQSPLRGSDGENSDSTFGDKLRDENAENPEEAAAKSDELARRRELLATALESLEPRQRHILVSRRLCDEPLTLETLAVEYGVSRERIRQIEIRALKDLRAHMLGAEEAVRPQTPVTRPKKDLVAA